ncbi:MAG: hypothetical protein M1834_007511 [Cirrosporium novae-zelandiae]|nr:MAG: hypothetical protein M1834_007511 [Cirrosporium novae-zelandiae]
MPPSRTLILSLLITLLLPSLVVSASQDLPINLMVARSEADTEATKKANEYNSENCSGPINYGHHSTLLHCVTMDETSHSVYLAGGTAHAYTDQSCGAHGGSNIGALPRGCVNLDKWRK